MELGWRVASRRGGMIGFGRLVGEGGGAVEGGGMKWCWQWCGIEDENGNLQIVRHDADECCSGFA